MTTESKELATINDAAQHFLAAANQAGGQDPLLKFSKGKYYVGDEEVAIGREYTGCMEGASVGWTKFVGGKVAEQKIGRISEGFVAENREALGDTDQSE